MECHSRFVSVRELGSDGNSRLIIGFGDCATLGGRRQTQDNVSLTKRDPLARPKLAELVQNRLLAVIKAENLGRATLSLPSAN